MRFGAIALCRTIGIELPHSRAVAEDRSIPHHRLMSEVAASPSPRGSNFVLLPRVSRRRS